MLRISFAANNRLGLLNILPAPMMPVSPKEEMPQH